MIEADFHPLGAITFAEARGQKVPDPIEVSGAYATMEIKQKKVEAEKEKNGEQEKTS